VVDYRHVQEDFIFKNSPDSLGPIQPLFNRYCLSFSGVKQLGRESIQSPSFSMEVKRGLSSTPPIQLHESDRGTFTLTVDVCNGEALRFL
jgi:hypothetical protein